MLRTCYDPSPKVIDTILGVGSSQQGFTLVGRQMVSSGRWATEFRKPDGRVVSNDKAALELAQANGAAAPHAPSLPRQPGRQKQERRISKSALWFREVASQAGWQVKGGGSRRSGAYAGTPIHLWEKAGVTKRSPLAVYNALQPLSRPDLPQWMDPAIVAKTGTPRVEEDCDEDIEEEGEEEEVEVEVEVVVLKAEAVWFASPSSATRSPSRTCHPSSRAHDADPRATRACAAGAPPNGRSRNGSPVLAGHRHRPGLRLPLLDEEGEVGGGAPHQREPDTVTSLDIEGNTV